MIIVLHKEMLLKQIRNKNVEILTPGLFYKLVYQITVYPAHVGHINPEAWVVLPKYMKGGRFQNRASL